MSASAAGRLAVGRTADPKLMSGLMLLLVFLCGAAAGAVVMNLGHARLHKPGFDTAAGKALSIEHLQKELDLTPAQTQQMQSILNDFWLYYRTVLSDGYDRVERVLTPEQRVKFERMMQDAQKQ